MLPGVAIAEQDAAWAWDYVRWLQMQNLPIPGDVTDALAERQHRVTELER